MRFAAGIIVGILIVGLAIWVGSLFYAGELGWLHFFIGLAGLFFGSIAGIMVRIEVRAKCK
jgi:hypothetical protein